MPRTRGFTHAFNAGEVSVAALARVDQERLRLAAETQENILGTVIGKGLMRPATGYIGATLSNNRCRLLPFIKSTTDTALLEMTAAKLRIWINDGLLTRASVTSSVTNGDFGGSGSWTLTATGGATSSIASNTLTLYSPNRGGSAFAQQAVSTSSTNTEHALRIVVSRGTVLFKCGSVTAGEDYITETPLDEGIHSLTFTPTASPYYIQFFTRSEVPVKVTNCTVESAGVVSIDAPWSENDLRLIRSDQSVDIVFLACGSWQQRKIERRSTTSWSLTKYRANDGPFTTARTSQVTLTPSVLSGTGTLTSDRAFFKSTHVGSLFRLFHEGQTVTNTLAAANEYTDTIKVTGNGTPDRNFTYAISGTWVGTLTGQRSVESAIAGFVDWVTKTGNTTLTDGESYTGPMWYRWGFKSGGYTSGAATITHTQGGSGGHGICRVIGFTSSTQVDIEVLDAFLATTPTKVWYEGEWSDRRGWPTAVAFHDGRLGWGRGDKFWLSSSDAYYTFGRTDDESITDASAISRSIATSGAVNSVNWMMSLQRLVFGTQGAESVARANSFDEPITPTNTQIKDASTQGSYPISPARIDKRGVYVQRSGTRVFELFYNFEQQDYDSGNMMEMAEDIGGDGILELAVQRQPDTYVWAVRADGQVPILIYEPKEKVMGWFRFVTDGADGEVESVTVLPGTAEDRVYLSVKRTISGSTVRYIEKLALQSEALGGATTKLGDCGTLTAGPVSSVTVAHLASQTGMVGWGTDGDGDQVLLTGLSANGSGVVSLGATYTNVWVGLPYTGLYKSAKLAYGGQGGTALLKKKRVGPVGLLLADVHPDAVTIGPSFDVMDQMPRIEEGTDTGTAVRTTYDEATFPFEGEWDTDARVCIKIAPGHPATLLGLVMEVETSE